MEVEKLSFKHLLIALLQPLKQLPVEFKVSLVVLAELSQIQLSAWSTGRWAHKITQESHHISLSMKQLSHPLR